MKEGIEKLNNWLTFSNLVKDKPISSQVTILKVIQEADDIIDLIKSEENTVPLIFDFLKGLINFNIPIIYFKRESLIKYQELIQSKFHIFSQNHKMEFINLILNLKFKWDDILPDLKFEILKFYFSELIMVRKNKILDIGYEFDNEKLEQLKKDKKSEVENVFSLTRIIKEIGCSYNELPKLIKQKYRCFISMYVYPGIKIGYQITDIRFLAELNKINFDEIFIYGDLKATLRDNIPQIISILESSFYLNNQTDITENNILTIVELSYKVLPFEEDVDYLEFNEILSKISKMVSNLHSRNIGISIENKDNIIRILQNVNDQYNHIDLPSEREVFVKISNEINITLLNLVRQFKVNLAEVHEPSNNRISLKLRNRE